MMKQILKLTIGDGQEQQIEVSVVRPGIGVHRVVTAGGETFNVWAVTHLATGHLVANVSFWRFKDARYFACCLPDIDWQAADVESSATSKVRRWIKELAEYYCQSGRAVGNEYLPSLIHDHIVKRYSPKRSY